MRRQQEEYLRRTSEDSTLPVSQNSSLSEGAMSPTAVVADSPFDGDSPFSHSSDVESLKRILQEVSNADFKNKFPYVCFVKCHLQH